MAMERLEKEIPDGWPAIKQKDLDRLINIIDQLKHDREDGKEALKQIAKKAMEVNSFYIINCNLYICLFLFFLSF